MRIPKKSRTLTRLALALAALHLSVAAGAFAAAPALVEVRHAPEADGKTRFTLTAKQPLTLAFKELVFNEKTDDVEPTRTLSTRRLRAGESETFSHLVPEGAPNLRVCATAASGPEAKRERCWTPFFSGEDGSLILDEGFAPGR